MDRMLKKHADQWLFPGKEEVLIVNRNAIGSTTPLFGSYLFHNIGVGDHGCKPVGIDEKCCLIIRVLQSPAWAKNRHDDNSLAKICLIVQTKVTPGPAFGRDRWSGFLSGLFLL